jgi:predicted PurR-regulated permease PerM
MAKSGKSSAAAGIERTIEAEGGGKEARMAVLFGRRFYRVAGLIFVLALFFKFFEPISRVLLIIFVAAIIGIAYNALIMRLPVGRKAGMAILGVGTLAAIGLAFWFAITFVAAELRAFIEDLPALETIIDDAETWIQDTLGLEVELLSENLQHVAGELWTAAGGFAILGGALGFVEVIAMLLLVLMGAFFIVAKPNEQLLIPLLRAVPQERRPTYRKMLSLMGERLSGWLVGTLVSMLMIGILSTLAFLLIGVPYAILLGVINGLLSIIPLIGAWIGGALAAIVVLFHDPARVLWVIIAIVIIQELEGNLVRPMVMSGAAHVHPFVTLIGLLLFTSMFGLLGAILSLPIVLLLGTLVEVLWVEETLDAGDDEIEPVVED